MDIHTRLYLIRHGQVVNFSEGTYNPSTLEKWRRKIIDHRMPEGESIRDLAGRVIPALKKILDANHGGNIVLLAHGGVNRVILADAMNLDLKNFYSIEQNYGCLNIIDYFPELAVVNLMNGQTF